MTRLKAKGRRGGEGERFAYMPESVMQSPALATAPHAAFRILGILVCGKPRERNGLMACSESYAARFGIDSRDTVRRSLAELERRGLIERTRRVQRFRKVPTLWAVTWWPIAYRDGEPLQVTEPASHRYKAWNVTTPTAGVNAEIPSHRPSDSLTPAKGVDDHRNHTDGVAQGSMHHTDSRGQSRFSGLGTQLAEARYADAISLARVDPTISVLDLSKRARCAETDAHRALQQVYGESSA